MKASFEGHEKIVKVLLAGGAKPDSSGRVRHWVLLAFLLITECICYSVHMHHICH